MDHIEINTSSIIVAINNRRAVKIKPNSKHVRSIGRTKSKRDKRGGGTGLPVPGTTRPRSGLISGAVCRD